MISPSTILERGFIVLVILLLAVGQHRLTGRGLSRRKTFFGVRVVPAFAESNGGQVILKRFQWRLWSWALVGAAAAALIQPHIAIWVGSMTTFLASSVAYALAHGCARREAGTIAAPTVRVASLAAKSEKNLWLEVLDCSVMVVPLVIPATTLVFLAFHWHQMPSSSHGVFFLVFYGLVLGLMCTANHWALRFRARSSDWASSPGASHKYRTYLGAMQALCFFIISCQMCGLAVMRLNGTVPWLRHLNMQTYFQVNYAALALGLGFAWSMRTWLTNHLAKESSDPMSDNCWKWGYFYFNPDDPAIVVPQRTGIGQSFNYARSSVWVLGGAVTLLMIAGIVQSGG